MLFPNTAYWIYTYPLLFSSKTMPPHVLVSLEQFLRNSWRKNMPWKVQAGQHMEKPTIDKSAFGRTSLLDISQGLTALFERSMA